MPQYNPTMQGGGGQGRQNEGQVDNNFASPQQPQGFKFNGVGTPGLAQMQQQSQSQARTPENDPSLAGPPQPAGQMNFGGYQPQRQAFGGVSGDPKFNETAPTGYLDLEHVLRGLQRGLA